MVDMAAIAGAASALKSAYDLSKAAIGLHDTAMMRAKVAEMQGEISSALASAIMAQTDQMAILQRVSDLEKQVADFEEWDREKDKYKLYHLGWVTYAYMLKPNTRGSEPPHWVCTKCYSEREIYIIQMILSNGQKFCCPNCKNNIVPSTTAFGAAGAPKWLD